MANRFVLPRQQVVDGNGNPYAGAKAYFYVSGTSTPLDTYSDNALTTPNTNPVVADSAGRFGDIFLGASPYKFILKTSADVTVFTADPVTGADGGSEATQAEVDARTADDVYVSPRRLADGLGLQGSSIASATALTLPTVGDSITVTGSTGPIATISTRAAGRRIRLRFTGAPTITHSSNIILPGGGNRTVSAGAVYEFESQGSGVWRMIDGLGYIPRSHIAGLTLSNNGTDATNDIDITAGECADSTGTRLIQLAASATRQLDVAFASGNGGLSSSLTIANGTYHVFAVIKSDGTSSVGFDTSLTAANLTTDHSITHYRHIGSIIRSAAAILSFDCYETEGGGVEVLWNDPPLDIDLANTLTTTARTDTLTVPNGISVTAIINAIFLDAASGFQAYISNPDVNDEATNSSSAPLATVSAAVNVTVSANIRVRTNTSAQIRARSNLASVDTYRVATLGWRWSRR